MDISCLSASSSHHNCDDYHVSDYNNNGSTKTKTTDLMVSMM